MLPYKLSFKDLFKCTLRVRFKRVLSQHEHEMLRKRWKFKHLRYHDCETCWRWSCDRIESLRTATTWSLFLKWACTCKSEFLFMVTCELTWLLHGITWGLVQHCSQHKVSYQRPSNRTWRPVMRSGRRTSRCFSVSAWSEHNSLYLVFLWVWLESNKADALC